MNVKAKLREIVGSENYFDSKKILAQYSQDYSLSRPGLPNFVVKPTTSEQVSQIVKFANELNLPVVPVSSAVHFFGATIPKQGGIVIDLSGMNKILEVDALNRRVRIEAGVTWSQLFDALAKTDKRIMMPLLPHPDRSVLTDYLEREVITNTVYDYGEPMQSLEVVWPNGDIFRMGSASVPGYPDSPSKGANPSGPGMDFYRFVQGAQGTMGVVTWTNLKIENQPKLDKILFYPVNDLGRTIEFLYRVLKMRIGQEVLLLNNVDLAAIMAEDTAEFEILRSNLPAWTLIMVLSGLQLKPEVKLKYEEDALRGVIRNEFPEMSLTDSIPGFPGSGTKLLTMIRKPWPKDVTYWKNRCRGGCQSITFFTKPNLAPLFINSVFEGAAEFDYPLSDIGCYIQPIEHNRACSLEFDFFFDPDDYAEVAQVRSLYEEITKTLFNQGAVFTRPYGSLSSLVYEKATGYASVLKKLKKIYDPNNIMNPGNLCF